MLNYFAGIVTGVKDLTTRTGRPFGRVMLEDFSGPYELPLFGKDYETFRPKIQLHASLFVTGEVKEKYALKPEERKAGKTVPYDFKISDIALLGNVSDTFVSSVTLNVSSAQVDAAFRSELVRVLKKFKGKTPLLLYIIDAQTGYKIEFKSKKFQVEVNSDFIDEIERLGLGYKITRK